MPSPKYRHRQPRRPPATLKGRVKRKSYYLNAMPSKGMYCVASKNSDAYDLEPLACHRVFQDALEDQNIPDSQGLTSRRGSERNIRCIGSRVDNTEQVPYKRSDELPIFQVTRCVNRTKRRGWAPGRGWVEVTDEDLAAAAVDTEDSLKETLTKWGMILVPAGALLAYMVAKQD